MSHEDDASRVFEGLFQPLPEIIKQSLGQMRHLRSAGASDEAVKAARSLLRQALAARQGLKKAEQEARDVLRENGAI